MEIFILQRKLEATVPVYKCRGVPCWAETKAQTRIGFDSLNIFNSIEEAIDYIKEKTKNDPEGMKITRLNIEEFKGKKYLDCIVEFIKEATVKVIDNNYYFHDEDDDIMEGYRKSSIKTEITDFGKFFKLEYKGFYRNLDYLNNTNGTL